MVVPTKIALGLLLWVSPVWCLGQLEGKYTSWVYNASNELEFFEDGSFHLATYGGAGKGLGEGNWRMVEDTLLLDFIAYQDSPYKYCSHIDLEYLTQSSDTDSFSVSVADCNFHTSIPFAIAIIYFFENSNYVPIDTIETDMTATACGKIASGVDSFIVLANAPEYIATDIDVKTDSGKDIIITFHLLLGGLGYIDPGTSWKFLLLKQDKKNFESQFVFKNGELGAPRRFMKVKPSWSKKKVLRKIMQFYDVK